jgi:hypothetical protein
MINKEENQKTEDDIKYANVPEGKLAILKECGLNYKGRNIIFHQLEDESIGIFIERLDRQDDDMPQTLRLNELTLNLLLLGIFRAGQEFNIDFEKITEEINEDLEKQQQNGSK